MSNIFTLENIEDFSEKLNIDELYEKKRQQDLNKLALFNKLLNRIHVKVKTVSRQKIDEQFCWYLMDKLKTSGFNVRYIHPNLLFISWAHWVPSYVRNEIKNKTGIILNEYGQKVEEGQDDMKMISNNPSDPNDYLLKQNDSNKDKQQKKEYTPIKSYKPSGNLLYGDDILNKIENKFV